MTNCTQTAITAEVAPSLPAIPFYTSFHFPQCQYDCDNLDKIVSSGTPCRVILHHQLPSADTKTTSPTLPHPQTAHHARLQHGPLPRALLPRQFTHHHRPLFLPPQTSSLLRSSHNTLRDALRNLVHHLPLLLSLLPNRPRHSLQRHQDPRRRLLHHPHLVFPHDAHSL